MRALRIVSIILVAFAALAFAVTWLLLSAPFLGEYRREIARAALADVLERDVRLTGELSFAPGTAIHVQFADLVIANATWGKARHLAKVSRGRMDIPFCALLFCKFEIRRLALHDSEINLEITPDGKRNWKPASAPMASAPEAGNATGFPYEIFTVLDVADNVHLTVADAANGWDVDLRTERYRAEQTGSIRIVDVAGKLNGKELNVKGKLDVTAPVDPLVDVTADVAGLAVELRREKYKTTAKEALFGLKLQSDSLDKLLETLELEKALAGKGWLDSRLRLADGKLEVDTFKSEVTIRTGEVVRAEGSMADVWNRAGLKARIEADLAPTMDFTAKSERLDGLRVLHISGELSGDIDALQLTELRLTTNLFESALEEIGPISAEALKRDPQGRIVLQGLKVLAGPPDQPYFELDGSIGDLLRLQKLTLSGRIDIPTRHILGFGAASKSEKLGRLQGAFGVSDIDGGLGVDTLSAEVKGSELLAMTTELKVGHIQALDEIKIEVRLSIPSFEALAGELGVEVEKLGTVGYQGNFEGGNKAATLNGSATIGRNKISGALTSALQDGRVFISGKIGTPHLFTDDLLRFYSIFGKLKAAGKETDQASSDEADETESNAIKYVDADVTVTADKIEGGRERASRLSSRIRLDNGKLQAGPTEVSFLGGRFNATVKTDLTRSKAPLEITGRADGWQLGTILKEKLTGIPIRGRLSANYQISGTGETIEAFAKTANGRVTLRVSNGLIGTSLIDLAGLGVLPWLFSGAAVQGQSKLTCAVAPFSFRNGRATTSATVVETERVQVIARGVIDFDKSTINMRAEPRPIGQPLAASAHPFTIKGPLSKPRVATAPATSSRTGGGIGQGAIANVLLAPFSGSANQRNARRPCEVQSSGNSRRRGQRRR